MTVPADPGPDRLLLDEMLPPTLAELLRERSVDCLAVASDPTLRVRGDPEIADVALQDGRVLATNNVVDFEVLRRQRLADGHDVPSLIYTSDRTFPRNRTFISRLAAAIEHAARLHLTSAHGVVLWLQPRDHHR